MDGLMGGWRTFRPTPTGSDDMYEQFVGFCPVSPLAPPLGSSR